MRGKTRRQEIVGAYRREQIQFIALIAASLILIIALCASCVHTRRINEAQNAVDEAGETYEYQLNQSGSVDLVSLWASLSAEDAQFILSMETYPRLVSSDSPLSVGYIPPDLVRLTGVPDGAGNRMVREAANAYMLLHAAMLEDGLAVWPLSTYRSYDEQTAILNNEIHKYSAQGMSADEARAAALRYVALPGSSEHQYGRSIDVTIDSTTNHSFHETEHGQWLIEHAHEYGFVIRYPADKEKLTGINYEPWHLRWVGREHADFMTRHNLCLEEYIILIKSHNSFAEMEK